MRRCAVSGNTLLGNGVDRVLNVGPGVGHTCPEELERLAEGIDVGGVPLDARPETNVASKVQKVKQKSARSQCCVVDGHIDGVECENPVFFAIGISEPKTCLTFWFVRSACPFA